MRNYLPADTYKRRKWEGEMSSGQRQGYGKLTYTHTTGYWVRPFSSPPTHPPTTCSSMLIPTYTHHRSAPGS